MYNRFNRSVNDLANNSRLPPILLSFADEFLESFSYPLLNRLYMKSKGRCPSLYIPAPLTIVNR